MNKLVGRSIKIALLLGFALLSCVSISIAGDFENNFTITNRPPAQALAIVKKPWTDYSITHVFVERAAGRTLKVKANMVNRGGVDRRNVNICFSLNGRGDACAASGQRIYLTQSAPVSGTITITAEASGADMSHDINDRNNKCRTALHISRFSSNFYCNQ